MKYKIRKKLNEHVKDCKYAEISENVKTNANCTNVLIHKKSTLFVFSESGISG